MIPPLNAGLFGLVMAGNKKTKRENYMAIEVKMSTASSRISDDPQYKEAFEKAQNGLDKSAQLINAAKEKLKEAKRNLRML